MNYIKWIIYILLCILSIIFIYESKEDQKKTKPKKKYNEMVKWYNIIILFVFNYIIFKEVNERSGWTLKQKLMGYPCLLILEFVMAALINKLHKE